MDVYNIIETAKKTGKVEKGTNEVTKAIERGTAKLVAYASDVDPKEVVQHLPALCKEKSVPCEEVDSKQKLGYSAGIPVSTSAIAIVDAGDAASDIENLKKQSAQAGSSTDSSSSQSDESGKSSDSSSSESGENK